MLGASVGSLVTYTRYRTAIGGLRRTLECLIADAARASSGHHNRAPGPQNECNNYLEASNNPRPSRVVSVSKREQQENHHEKEDAGVTM